MVYKIVLDNGQKEDFVVYKYHYQDVNLKEQFDSEFPNICALYKKVDDSIELVRLFILDNPKKFFTDGLIDNDLYSTDFVLLSHGSRPGQGTMDINEFLKKKMKTIEKVFPKTISAKLFQ